jgi:hypothetical protein
MNPGDELRNGAFVLECADAGHCKVILAIMPGHMAPFVTWVCTNNDTYWGHYHCELESAITEFKKRFKKVLSDSLQPVA